MPKNPCFIDCNNVKKKPITIALRFTIKKKKKK